MLAMTIAITSCTESVDGPPVDADTSEPTPPGGLGAFCMDDSECLSGLCLESEYGPTFCSRSCDVPQTACSDGSDSVGLSTLCISFDDRPRVEFPFVGDMSTFCVPVCGNVGDCLDINPNWETCEQPKHLGNPLYPMLGNLKVCMAPSYQGKDPVDPSLCDWQKTISNATGSAALICEKYCSYLEKCKILPQGTQMSCCQWGCFNQMVLEGEVVDIWYDTAKCYVDSHHAYPDVGPKNSCSAPVQDCGGYPEDPTPPAARSAH